MNREDELGMVVQMKSLLDAEKFINVRVIISVSVHQNGKKTVLSPDHKTTMKGTSIAATVSSTKLMLPLEECAALIAAAGEADEPELVADRLVDAIDVVEEATDVTIVVGVGSLLESVVEIVVDSAAVELEDALDEEDADDAGAAVDADEEAEDDAPPPVIVKLGLMLPESPNTARVFSIDDCV